MILTPDMYISFLASILQDNDGGRLDGLVHVFNPGIWHPVLGTASQTLHGSPAVDRMGNSFPTADRVTWISSETEIFTEDT